MRFVEIDRATPEWDEWHTGVNSDHFPAIVGISAAIIGGANSSQSAKSLFDCFSSSGNPLSITFPSHIYTLNHLTNEELGFNAQEYIPFLIENRDHPWQRARLDGVNLDCTSAALLKVVSAQEQLATNQIHYDECQWAMLTSQGELKHIYLCSISHDGNLLAVDKVFPSTARQVELLSLASEWRAMVLQSNYTWVDGHSRAAA